VYLQVTNCPDILVASATDLSNQDRSWKNYCHLGLFWGVYREAGPGLCTLRQACKLEKWTCQKMGLKNGLSLGCWACEILGASNSEGAASQLSDQMRTLPWNNFNFRSLGLFLVVFPQAQADAASS
jgi:hypothetical protein